jgi:transcriptional regulator with XRE-family HTH domain
MTCVVARRPRTDDPDRERSWERRRQIVGARIRALRLEGGLSQESLALESGLSRDQVIQMEHGRRGLLVERLYDVAVVLGVPVSDLVPDDTDRKARRT